ncbi:MAG: hypothetical protein AAF193_06200, partial [Bacteroidota bacterium]
MQKALLILTLLISTAMLGQKVKTETAKIDFMQIPSVPVEGVSKIGLNAYVGDLPMNHDTLRLYLNNLDLMMSDVEQKAKIKHKSLTDVALVAGEGDLTVDIAFGMALSVGTETKTNSCVPKKDGCSQYYYNVKYRMPAIVQIRKGDQVINSWELDPMMDLKFGNEQVETHESVDEGSKTTIRIIQYKSEEDLALAFASHGEDELARKGM